MRSWCAPLSGSGHQFGEVFGVDLSLEHVQVVRVAQGGAGGQFQHHVQPLDGVLLEAEPAAVQLQDALGQGQADEQGVGVAASFAL